MTDEQGLSIFGSSTSPDSSGAAFPVARRGGYDRQAVDDFVRANESGRREATAALERAEQRQQQLQAEVDQLHHTMAEAEAPTYSGLGGRASEMLRLAEEQADEVVAGAKRDADNIRSQAESDAKALRADAETEANDIRTVQLSEADELRATARTDAEQLRAHAKAEGDDLVAAARREADQIRLAAQQEANAQLTSARREAEQSRATADREVQEARRTLAVEKERLSKEATERHTQAIDETKRMLTDAEERAKAAEDPRG